MAASMGGGAPSPSSRAQNGLFALLPQGQQYRPAAATTMGIAMWRYRDRRTEPYHISEYFGPPPPSGGTQVMLRLGSLMSQVLQWTQFCALMTKRGVPPSSTHS